MMIKKQKKEQQLKGVILAAGYGTRFLPVTKTVPKEMLPLINKPSIDFIIEEFLHSGIREILVITSRRKQSLEDYIDREIELESVFNREGAHQKLKKVHPPEAHFYFVRQKEMKGTGQALLLAKPFVNNEPFVVAYPDDLHFGEKPLSLQLIEKYNETGCCVLATLHNPPDINRYGVISMEADGIHVKDIVEKPVKGSEPGKEASIGRFLYIPEIFEWLEKGLKEHTSGEYYHTYAVRALAKLGKVVYKQVDGMRLDTGEPGGYLEAIIRYANTIPEYKEVLKKILSETGNVKNF